MTDRRTFIRGALAGSAVALGGGLPSGRRTPCVRFGMVTDIHYADRDTVDSRGWLEPDVYRVFRDGVKKLDDAVAELNRHAPDFLIELGDFKDDSGSAERSLAALDELERSMRRFRGGLHHALGNHDTDVVSVEEFLAHVENTGFEKARAHYSFRRGGITFIVLDCNYTSDMKRYCRNNPWTDANLPPEEFAWFREELASAPGKVVVFNHQRLDPFAVSNHAVRNAAEIRKAMEASGKVIAVFTGHQHNGGTWMHGGIVYHTLRAMVGNRHGEDNAFALVEIYEDGAIAVTGFARAASAGWNAARTFDDACYDVVVLGDTHYDAEPESVYHAEYHEPKDWLNKVQRAEFARNGEMWRDRCPRLLKRAAANVDAMTAFTLQMGDLIQGDCGSAAVHRKMLDDVMNAFKRELGGLPFVTVVGNHDIRGNDRNDDYGARVYAEYMPGRMSAELGREIRKTTFSFRRGKDVFVVVDFNHPDDKEIVRLFRESEDARYTFVVTHGPVFPFDGGSCRWYLHGYDADPAARNRIRELFARRQAIVLNGHTHRLELLDWYGMGGRITQFSMNSVWTPKTPVRPKFDTCTAAGYGEYRKTMTYAGGYVPKPAPEVFEEIRPGIRRYYHAEFAGSYKIHVSDGGVAVDVFGGDRQAPCQVVKLR